MTHKGAAADAGHYMAYVKKRAFHPVSYVASGESSTTSVTQSATMATLRRSERVVFGEASGTGEVYGRGGLPPNRAIGALP